MRRQREKQHLRPIACEGLRSGRTPVVHRTGGGDEEE